MIQINVGEIWQHKAASGGDHRIEILRVLSQGEFLFRLDPLTHPGIEETKLGQTRYLEHYNCIYRDDDEVPL